MALGAFGVAAAIPFTFFQKHAVKILLVGLAACAILAVAGWLGLSIAQCSLGACRWFSLGGLGTLQPAEILKFGVLIFLGGFLGMRAGQGAVNDVQKTLIPVGIVAALAMLFVV